MMEAMDMEDMIEPIDEDVIPESIWLVADPREDLPRCG